MAGVDRKRRGKLLEEYIDVMRRAWTGEPFEWQGRTIRVTPQPVTQPHPMILIGGSTEIAARRAARLRLPFLPAIGDPALAELYRDECERVGFAGGFVMLPPKGPGSSTSPTTPSGWARSARTRCTTRRPTTAGRRRGSAPRWRWAADTLDELRRAASTGSSRQTSAWRSPRRAARSCSTRSWAASRPTLGWESLELFASKVLPRLT